MNQAHTELPASSIDTLGVRIGAPSLGACVCTGRGGALPLQVMRMRTRLGAGFSLSHIEFLYKHVGSGVIDVEHIFPLATGAAVTAMTYGVDGRWYDAAIRPRAEADAIFDAAQQAGLGAAQVDGAARESNRLRIANVPPGGEVTIRLSVSEPLTSLDGAWLWRMPTSISPRYAAPHADTEDAQLPPATWVPWIPPVVSLPVVPTHRAQTGALMDVQVRIDEPVHRIECSSHASSLTMDEHTWVQLRPDASMDSDIVLRFVPRTVTEPRAVAWVGAGHSILHVVRPPSVTDRLPRDVVYLIDRSGSMNGTKMTAALRAVRAALRGLDESDRFEILAFDNVVERFSYRAVEVTQENIEEADRWLTTINARGGTRLAEALREAIAPSASDSSGTEEQRMRSVLCLTDGQVYDTDNIVRVVSKRGTRCVVAALGIDDAVAGDVIERIARAGGGSADYVLPGDAIEPVVASIEMRLGAPAAFDVHANKVEPAHDGAIAVYDGAVTPILYRGELPDGSLITLDTAQGPVEVRVDVKPSSLPISQWFAMRRVRTIEDLRATERMNAADAAGEIEALGLAASIATTETSWIVVDEEGEAIDRALVGREVVAGAYSTGVTARSGVSFGGVPMPQSAPPPTGARTSFPPVGATAKKTKMVSSVASRLRSPVPREDAMVGRPPTLSAPSPAAPAVECAAQDVLASKMGHGSVAFEPAESLDVRIAAAMRANGSVQDDTLFTADALIAMCVLGHSTKRGVYRRHLAKMSAWLKGRTLFDPWADLILDIISERITPRDARRALEELGPIGVYTKELLSS